MAQTVKMTMQTVKNIMNKRTLIPAEAVGKRVVLIIQGDGNTIDVTKKDGTLVESAAEPGTVLQKRIYNVRANSGIAMNNMLNRELLKEGIAAEKAGNMDLAHEKFNEYLNNVQISFGVLLPSKLVEKLADKVEINARIQQITTDNGSLLTLDPDTISVVKAEEYGKTSFSFEEFEEEAAPAASEVVAAEAMTA